MTCSDIHMRPPGGRKIPVNGNMKAPIKSSFKGMYIMIMENMTMIISVA